MNRISFSLDFIRLHFTLVGSIICVTLFLLNLGSLKAQKINIIEGYVLTEKDEPLPGVNVLVEGTNRGAVTNSQGYYRLVGIPDGIHIIIAEYVGRETQRQVVNLQGGQTIQINFRLSIKPLLMPGVVVTATRTEEVAENMTALAPTVIRRSPVRVTGELLRKLPGVDAIRRGPVGLDPVVRGLRETEIGAYLDGTRLFPGGPARMDSPLSHLDPSAVQKIQVIKGPYALTWGAGNLSAIRVETQVLPPPSEGRLHGTFSSGFHSNLNAAEVATSIFGKHEKVSYWAHGVWRQGDDFKSGSDRNVPADFLSRELRGKLGVRVVPGSHLTFSVGYQNQKDIDYPGRLLNADFFNTYNFSVLWRIKQPNRWLHSVDLLGYYNKINHRMDNDGKPTAVPNPDRMPPFALLVKVNSEVRVIGGRLAVGIVPDEHWNFEVGTDIYQTNRDALRTISRRDNGLLLFEDLMWPDATITDAGLFFRATRKFGGTFRAAGTVRFDLVQADADTASEFFLENASNDLSTFETHVSGAVTFSTLLSEHWLVSFGVGSVVRTADATERYSDRIPASKAQTSAEFMGNPALEPERSTQVDVWLEADYPGFSLNINAFARHIDNYVTLEPTELPKRLPLSPATVFRYINGDTRFWGFEASGVYNFTSLLSLKLGMKYLWGEDKTLKEPALGVSPLGTDVGLRYEASNERYFMESILHATAKQKRVAKARGELPTNGYVTADLVAGTQIWQGLELRFGVMNLTDKYYVNHLNAKNPFTGVPIAEPGRVFFTNLSYAF